MTRREFTRRIAESYAAFEADCRDHHAGATPTPLDRHWAFRRGSELIQDGAYVPRVNALDYTRIAREARRQLPGARNLISRVNAEYPDRRCHVCGGYFRTETTT